MNGNKTIKDIITVSFSNLIKLLAGVLVGFVLPKIIGVTDYGYYKTFTLYATYVGIFHFGFEDGIYLKFGGQDYSVLNKNKFRAYSFWLLIVELIISVIGVIVAIAFLENNFKFIFISVSLYIFVYNITGYYQLVSQITSRFKELSLRNIFQSFLTVISIISLFILHKTNVISANYKIYVTIFIGIQLILTTWYIITYKDITFGNRDKVTLNEVKEIVKLGFPLMISNLCLLLILVIDRQFVSVLWPLEESNTYSMYSFAYNMLSLITTATSAISTVIYPSMKKMSVDKLNNSYSYFSRIILIFVFACILVYYPLSLFINWFLPNYTLSLNTFRIILPGITLSSMITIIIQNYYKIHNKNHIFFYITIFVLIISIGFNMLAYLMFKSVSAISFASILVLFIWYIVSTYTLKRYVDIKFKKNTFYIIIMISAFYLITLIDNLWISAAVNIIGYLIVTLLFYGADIKEFLIQLKKQYNRN